jgi:hypothetical protein
MQGVGEGDRGRDCNNKPGFVSFPWKGKKKLKREEDLPIPNNPSCRSSGDPMVKK